MSNPQKGTQATVRVAVLTLTRDRLDYTQHCFARLHDLAGCDYTHFVHDQASRDGTPGWLTRQPRLQVTLGDTNAGITVALNRMLDRWDIPARYDVLVRFDNDCELTQPDTVKVCAHIAHEYEVIVAPKVQGLYHPPPTIGQVRAGDWTIDETPVLGGIFMAIPASLFTEHGYRYDESQPVYGGDELIVPWWRARGGHAGYLRGLAVNHYERRDEQRHRHPDYQARKDREMAAR